MHNLLAKLSAILKGLPTENCVLVLMSSLPEGDPLSIISTLAQQVCNQAYVLIRNSTETDRLLHVSADLEKAIPLTFNADEMQLFCSTLVLQENKPLTLTEKQLWRIAKTISPSQQSPIEMRISPTLKTTIDEYCQKKMPNFFLIKKSSEEALQNKYLNDSGALQEVLANILSDSQADSLRTLNQRIIKILNDARFDAPQEMLGKLGSGSKYNLCLIADMPKTGELSPDTVYLEKQEHGLRYLVITPDGRQIDSQLNIEVYGELTAAVLSELKDSILDETSKRGHTPIARWAKINKNIPIVTESGELIPGRWLLEIYMGVEPCSRDSSIKLDYSNPILNEISAIHQRAAVELDTLLAIQMATSESMAHSAHETVDALSQASSSSSCSATPISHSVELAAANNLCSNANLSTAPETSLEQIQRRLEKITSLTALAAIHEAQLVQTTIGPRRSISGVLFTVICDIFAQEIRRKHWQIAEAEAAEGTTNKKMRAFNERLKAAQALAIHAAEFNLCFHGDGVKAQINHIIEDLLAYVLADIYGLFTGSMQTKLAILKNLDVLAEDMQVATSSDADLTPPRVKKQDKRHQPRENIVSKLLSRTQASFLPPTSPTLFSSPPSRRKSEPYTPSLENFEIVQTIVAPYSEVLNNIDYMLRIIIDNIEKMMPYKDNAHLSALLEQLKLCLLKLVTYKSEVMAAVGQHASLSHTPRSLSSPRGEQGPDEGYILAKTPPPPIQRLEPGYPTPPSSLAGQRAVPYLLSTTPTPLRSPTPPKSLKLSSSSVPAASAFKSAPSSPVVQKQRTSSFS